MPHRRMQGKVAMRLVLTVAVLLAVVATAMVAVCQHGETRRLQRRVWQLEQRRIRLERCAQRLRAAIEATRTPRRLLVARDLAVRPGGAALEPAHAPAAVAAPSLGDPELPTGFRPGANFEGIGR